MQFDRKLIMGRRRKNNFSFPPRMYLKHGAFYYVSRENKWIRLSDDKAIAFAKWAEIEGETPRENGSEKPLAESVGALIEKYMIEIAPRKAKSTYQGNLIEAKNLKDVFGKMPVLEIRPMHIAKYLDIRGIKAPIGQIEKSLYFPIYSAMQCVGVKLTETLVLG